MHPTWLTMTFRNVRCFRRFPEGGEDCLPDVLSWWCLPCEVNTARLSSHTEFFSTCVLSAHKHLRRALRMQVEAAPSAFPTSSHSLRVCSCSSTDCTLDLFKWHWRDHRVSVISSIPMLLLRIGIWKKLFLDAVNCLQSCSKKWPKSGWGHVVMLQLVCSR